MTVPVLNFSRRRRRMLTEARTARTGACGCVNGDRQQFVVYVYMADAQRR
jgi:hypothetical protein